MNHSIRHYFPSSVHRRIHGAALVIVLSFVVLVTVMIVAFFSRALSQRQASNSSASQVKVAEFAKGAADEIIGDLKQEIAAGSVGVATTSGTIYLSGTNQTFVPALVVSTGTSGLQNLLKISKNNQPFFPVTSNYNFANNTVTSSGTTTVNYPASNRAANVSTSGTSLNGRYWTAARWNQALLMPVTSGSDYTPLLSSGTFIMPDWVLVARDGSTPAPAAYTPALAWSATNSSTIVGRYAYAIYDEGGLLDVNAAGYPSTSGALAGYKPALAYADLTQIFSAAGISSGSASTMSDALVGWRNYATTQAPGSFPNPNFTAASGSNYWNYVLANQNGFLTTGASFYNGQTDRVFSSRQQLINFMQNGLGLSGTNLNALNYLATFTRAVDQPAFSPDPARPITVPYDANCSTEASTTTHNNVFTASDHTGSNTAGGNDNLINPSYLQVRVGAAFTRNDGSTAAIGEPLVKKRFNLMRLAWLTYKGPLSDGLFTGVATTAANVNSTDPDLTLMAQYLHNYYGLSYAFLQQGTKQNVYNYFGLSWITTKMYDESAARYRWLYNHSNSNATGPFVSVPAAGGPILRVGHGASVTPAPTIYVQDLPQGREPDFFELLKSGIACGSKAKASRCLNNTGSGQYSSNSYYYPHDTSLEYAIIQLGANIIDQFDLDGYPTDILYTDGSLLIKDVYGVESLPYLYGVRFNAVQGDLTAVSGTTSVTNTGYLVQLMNPLLWNPHDQQSPRCAVDSSGAYLTDSSGNPLFPTNFRCVADTIDPDHVNSSATGYWQGAGTLRTNNYKPVVPTPINPVFTKLANGNVSNISGVPTFVWSAESTALSFTVDRTTTAEGYFREPTLLISSNVAGGTLQASGTLNVMVPNLITTGTTSPANGQAADLNMAATPLNAQGMYCGLDGKRYLGMYYGTMPLVWLTGSPPALVALGYRLDNFNRQNGTTFRVQFKDKNGIWVSFDSKYINPFDYGNPGGFPVTGYNLKPDATGLVAEEGSMFFDPRTGRFAPTLACDAPYASDPAPFSSGWLSSLGLNAGATNTDWPSPTTAVPTQRMNTGYQEPTAFLTAGWHLQSENNPNSPLNGLTDDMACPGSETVNNPNFTITGASKPHYYSDPDGMVRRAMGAYTTTNLFGLPMAVASTYPGSTASSTSQVQSRPIVLNRPFRSVGELGYVFSDTPWKTIDFITPESGDAALLDLFCVNDNTDPNGLEAGKVDLNTRQAPVLAAILAGAYKDEQASYLTPPTWKLTPLGTTTPLEPSAIAAALIARTTNTTNPSMGPLRNPSELVGRYTGINNAYGQPYDGFSNDLTSVFVANTVTGNVQRMREAPIRALAASGQARVWNLLIDVVAQTGRYPASANSLNSFNVEGEQRYWVHVAIDRYTGLILDKVVEVVKQ
jgi:hypothetical protein